MTIKSAAAAGTEEGWEALGRWATSSIEQVLQVVLGVLHTFGSLCCPVESGPSLGACTVSPDPHHTETLKYSNGFHVNKILVDSEYRVFASMDKMEHICSIT